MSEKEKTGSATTTKTALELLEEDDEFEEFEAGGESGPSSSAANVSEDSQLWQDAWDDDEQNDDFTDQLRVQMASAAPTITAPATTTNA